MNITIIYYIIVAIILLATVVTIVSSYISSHKNITKGKRAEKNIEKTLKSLSIPNAKILRNLYIPTNEGITTEIDLVMICTQGIFVIESKNYCGVIRGRADEKNWTQTIQGSAYRPIVRNFYNPVWQNEGHIKGLNKIILLKNTPLYSLIVFSDKCELNVPSVCNQSRILKFDKLKSVVRHLIKEKELLNEKDVNALYNQLKPYTKVSLATKKAHIENVKKIKQGNFHCN